VNIELRLRTINWVLKNNRYINDDRRTELLIERKGLLKKVAEEKRA
jgi:hypothetical protein